MRLASAVIVLVGLCASYAFGAGDPQRTNIAQIDATNFEEIVVKSESAWILEFYSPRCGSCQEFSPLFAQLAAAHPSHSFGKVSVDDPAGMELAERTGALEEGLPSVKAYVKRGDNVGVKMWSGDDTPPFSEVEDAFRSVFSGGSSYLKHK